MNSRRENESRPRRFLCVTFFRTRRARHKPTGRPTPSRRYAHNQFPVCIITTLDIIRHTYTCTCALKRSTLFLSISFFFFFLLDILFTRSENGFDGVISYITYLRYYNIIRCRSRNRFFPPSELYNNNKNDDDDDDNSEYTRARRSYASDKWF
jgi:hypothetical protein